MGTELNFFHIRNSSIERFADRKPSVSPIRLPEMYGGYDQFLDYRDRCKELRDFIYTTAYGEFVVDYDLRVILFFMSYSELASDYIRHAHDLVAQISATWPDWRIVWACAGDTQTRAYVELSRSGRVQFLRSLPLDSNTDLIDFGDTPKPDKKEVDLPLDALESLFRSTIDSCRDLYGDAWLDLLPFELTQQYLDAIQTTVLHVGERGSYNRFYFSDRVERLLSRGDSFIQFCRDEDSYVTRDELFPDEFRGLLAYHIDGSSMVIDDAKKMVVIVTPPKKEYVARCLETLQGVNWQEWQIVFDLSLLAAYQNRIRS